MSPPEPRARIRVGVAGWDYPDWNGIVYPAGGGRKLDRLRWISRFVDLLEINSTFYRPASPRVAESWLRRTEDRKDLTFTAKSHRSWTHDAPSDLATQVEPTLDGLRPLKDGGRLGALLVQFPQSYHAVPASRERLARLSELLDGWPVVVEVRHRSWDDDEARDWFSSLGLGWCVVDQPRVGRTTIGARPRVCGSTAYLRLHGRNAADWFRPDAGRDARYDYLYSAAELRGAAATVREMAAEAEQLFVVQNNHFRGQALVNTLQLRHLLDGRRHDAPEELVAAYPELEPVVRFERRRLF